MRIFCDARFPEDADALLRAGCHEHTLEVSAKAGASNLTPTDADPAAAAAEVLFGQPSLQAIEAAAKLRWVHLTSAGYARYATDEARALLSARQIRLTNSSSVYAEPCAEQAIAGMLALGRRLDLCLAAQPEAAWPSAEHRKQARLLRGERVVLLGFGAIGRALAVRLRAFGAQVRALRRHPSPDDLVETFGAADLERHLREADHVVNILPGDDGTAGFMDAARFAQMKPGAFFMNVGRGTTVVQDDLLEALTRGPLGGAYLDVTDPEPLPTGHPLWSAPRCIVSPHIAGGQPDEHKALVRHFLDNLGRFTRGEDLIDETLRHNR